MKIDSEVVDMIAKVVAVNAAAVLLLAVMSYVLAALMLNGLASLESWLDPSLKPESSSPDPQGAHQQPPPLSRNG
jgi:uncharacterized membrane protein